MNGEERPLRIAYLTSVYPRATDTFIRNEVEYLRTIGHQVMTFSVRRPPSDQVANANVVNELENTTYLLQKNASRLLIDFLFCVRTCPLVLLSSMRLAWRTGQKGFVARLKLLAYLFEACSLARYLQRAQLEHLHNHFGENSATVAMLAANIAGIPYSLTIHGPGIFFHPRLWALGEKITRSSFTACISSFCLSQCMIFTPPSQWFRLHVIRCAVHPMFFEQQPSIFPDRLILLVVGRLCPEKGQILIIEALRELLEECLDIQIIFVGDGESRAQIEARVSRYSLQNHVEMVGWLPSDEVKSLLLRSSGLLSASFAEGLPVSIMEAMALGKPVITTDIAGIPELVRHRENGWLVTPGSVASLVETIREVYTCPRERLVRMGMHGAARVREKHNVLIEIPKLVQLFSRCRQETVNSGVERMHHSS